MQKCKRARNCMHSACGWEGLGGWENHDRGKPAAHLLEVIFHCVGEARLLAANGVVKKSSPRSLCFLEVTPSASFFTELGWNDVCTR